MPELSPRRWANPQGDAAHRSHPQPHIMGRGSRQAMPLCGGGAGEEPDARAQPPTEGLSAKHSRHDFNRPGHAGGRYTEEDRGQE